MPDPNAMSMHVHPAADVFPMLDEDAMSDFVGSVERHGLLEPLVVCELDGQTVLLDGRIRREACHRLGIVPDTKQLDEGIDPVQYVLSANLNRYHRSDSQRAMANAMFESEHGDGEAAKQARAVLKHAPSLASNVVAGSRSLREAYRLTREWVAASDDKANKAATLRLQAPDLLSAVHQGELSLDEALGELQQRTKVEKARRARVHKCLAAVNELCEMLQDDDGRDWLRARIAESGKGESLEALSRVGEVAPLAALLHTQLTDTDTAQ